MAGATEKIKISLEFSDAGASAVVKKLESSFRGLASAANQLDTKGISKVRDRIKSFDGAGRRNIETIREIVNAGAEKVIINTYAVENPDFIKEASDYFGSSTIVVSIDVKKKRFGKKQVFIEAGTKATGLNAVDFAKLMQEKGAGEIIINSIDKDGTMSGYDLQLVEEVSKAVTIPVVASGGAGSFNDFKDAVKSYASAVAAGSKFVYHGARKAVLINYPTHKELKKLFYENTY
jgi:cyclase